MKIEVKPSQIKTHRDFMGTVWQNFEKETVARNIVLLAKEQGDFKSFTFQDYKEFCSHDVTDSELDVLEELAEEGYLHILSDNEYLVTASFIGVVLLV